VGACAGRSGSAASAGGTAAAPAAAPGAPVVGPARGAVVVVGGGQQGPEVLARFIELAGGPDALIAVVPTAAGDSIDPAADGTRAFRAAGARNVVMYHTTSKAVADADSFVGRIASARGVWFGGGRHFRLVNSYAGTKSQRAFEAVLARGGVVGGSSAGPPSSAATWCAARRRTTTAS
jgi:cyanophycinase-like exopeptidase